MNKRNLAALTTLFLLLAPMAEAKDEGFYIGAGIGAASMEQKGSGGDLGHFSIDDSDFAYKLFGGYQISALFAVEGGYRDLGKPSSRIAETRVEGFDLAAVAGLPLGPVRLFAKLGTVYWDSDTRFTGDYATSGEHGFNLMAGAGLEFELFSLGIRGEVEYLDTIGDTWMYSVGATYTF